MHKVYKHVKVRMFRWKDDGNGDINAQRLGREFESRGYDVQLINEDDMGIVNRYVQSDEEMDDAAEEWFKGWLDDEATAPEGDETDKLLVFCYFGHGQYDVNYNRWVDGTLYEMMEVGNRDPVSNKSTKFFHMTPLREAARDDVDFDFLFLLESCFGGVEDLVHPSVSGEDIHWVPEGKVMETLASSEDVYLRGGDNSDWSQRLAEKLEEERLSGITKSVRQRHFEMADAKAVWRREDGDEDIVLPDLSSS